MTTNPYTIELDGCGNRGHKAIRVELTPDDARRLAEWNLDGLDCCGGPLIEVTPIKAGATYGTGILREDTDG